MVHNNLSIQNAVHMVHNNLGIQNVVHMVHNNLRMHQLVGRAARSAGPGGPGGAEPPRENEARSGWGPGGTSTHIPVL